MWESYKKGFRAYLQLEKSLSDNSVQAYLRDIDKLTEFLEQSGKLQEPAVLELKDLHKRASFLEFVPFIITAQ
jgi:integrase/recombinase XerD